MAGTLASSGERRLPKKNAEDVAKCWTGFLDEFVGKFAGNTSRMFEHLCGIAADVVVKNFLKVMTLCHQVPCNVFGLHYQLLNH